MCGRFNLAEGPAAIAEAFDLGPELPILSPRYNVAPGQLVAVVGLKPDQVTRGLALIKWGLVPQDSPTANPRIKPINAKAETVDRLPMFTEPFRRRRCLVPATGFYEWRPTDRQPFNFHLADRAPIAFAGLWDVWRGEGKPLVTTCIITTRANELVSPVHDRMPVMLPREAYAAWLAPETPVPELRRLLVPYPADRMRAYPVGRGVGSVKNDGPECVAEVDLVTAKGA